MWSVTLPGLPGQCITVTMAEGEDPPVTVEVVGSLVVWGEALPSGPHTGHVTTRAAMTLDDLRAMLRVVETWPGVTRE